MKKITSLLVVLFCLNFAVTAQSFPDGGFETSWTEHADPHPDEDTYLNYSNYLVITLNSIRETWVTGEMETPITAFRDMNPHGGDYAMRLVSRHFDMGEDEILIPGALGTFNENFMETFLAGDGISIYQNVEAAFDDEYPIGITGFYKYAPLNGDSASIEMGYRNVISGGYEELTHRKMVITEEVNDWTSFTVEVDRSIVADNPIIDEMSLIFVGSANYDFYELTNCQGHEYSTLWLDDVAFVYASGLKEYITPRLQVNTFPNPSVDVVNIQLDKEFSGEVVVYNLQGATMAKQAVNNSTT